MKKLKLGIIREGKTPPDKRVPLTPLECKELANKFPQVELYIQPSEIRIFNDSEYSDLGISLKEDLSDCDVLIGVKEVPSSMLIPNKTYFFFSHTTKKQPYNQKLLQTILEKKITLVDWEHLTNKEGTRVIAFGRYAGIVGAYNGILTYGKKFDLFDIKTANSCFDMVDMKKEYTKVKLPNIKIALTGNGRVAHGSMEVLNEMNIKKVSVNDYLNKSFDEPVYCQLSAKDYNIKKDGTFNKSEFYSDPTEYKSNFSRFTKVTDLLISGAFWAPQYPILFTREETKSPDFKITVIADITMDIDGSIPTTLKPATIQSPYYDYNPDTGKLEDAFSSSSNITEMAVDNLPCELPRDASRDFGREFIDNVLPNILDSDSSDMVANATISTSNGDLAEQFLYLEDYAGGVIS